MKIRFRKVVYLILVLFAGEFFSTLTAAACGDKFCLSSIQVQDGVDGFVTYLNSPNHQCPAALQDESDSDFLLEEDDLLENIFSGPFGIARFRQVSEGIFRSGEPSFQGIAELKRRGFKSILNLTRDARKETATADPIGIEVIHVPMRAWWAPSFKRMDRAIEVLRKAPRPILVHCRRGKDRTGFVVAAYRVVVEGMPIDDAVREAKSVGCCRRFFGSLGNYLRHYQK